MFKLPQRLKEARAWSYTPKCGVLRSVLLGLTGFPNMKVAKQFLMLSILSYIGRIIRADET